MRIFKLLLGFAALAVVGLVLLVVLNKDEIAAHARARAKVADEGLSTITGRLQKIRRAVAAFALEEKACPEPMRSARLDYLPTSMSQLALFDPTEADQNQHGIEWYRAKDLAPLAPRGPADKAPSKFEIADTVAKVLKYPYLAVFIPLEQRWPKVVDAKTFDGGAFDGWVVLVDFERQAIECSARFSAASSETLAGGPAISIARGLAEIPLTSMKKSAEEDFKSNFWHAANAAIERVRLDRTAPM